MTNQHFFVDWLFGGNPEPISNDEFSDTLQALRAGQDFVPGNPLALELFHESAYDRGSGKYVKRLAATCFFNVPEVDENGIITSTADWPYSTIDDFWGYLKNTEYRKFIEEHWAKNDYDSKFCSASDFQVIRVLFANDFVPVDRDSFVIKAKNFFP